MGRTVEEYWVARIRLPRPVQAFGAGYHCPVAVLGPGLGRQQVVVFTQSVDMAPLRQPRGVQRQTADVEQTGFTQRVSGLEVDLGDPDGEVAGVGVFELRAHCGGEVGLAVVVEEEVRIEAPSGVCA